MSEVALEFNHVWKKFKKGEKYNSLRDLIPAMTKRLFSGNHRDKLQEKEFWAVKDVSFQVKRGEALGIIGSNGAGKSTILKLLSGILRPNKGEIKVNGRLSALIEVGAGFHPDLTGRENVYLNGSILGMKREEIDAKFDEIVAFSELEEFIDTPVKRYSSGMYVRLGFAVSAHISPEILLVDEVLSVGDISFQSKCLNRLAMLRKSGVTILLVTHSMDTVQNVCDRAVLLNKGGIMYDGDSNIAVKKYQEMSISCQEQQGTKWLFNSSKPDSEKELSERKRGQIIDVAFIGSEGMERLRCVTGDPLTLRIEFVAYERIREPIFAVHFYRGRERYVSFITKLANGIEGAGVMELQISNLVVPWGLYHIDIIFADEFEYNHIDWHHGMYELTVTTNQAGQGLTCLPHTWVFRRLNHLNTIASKTKNTGDIHVLTLNFAKSNKKKGKS